MNREYIGKNAKDEDFDKLVNKLKEGYSLNNEEIELLVEDAFYDISYMRDELLTKLSSFRSTLYSSIICMKLNKDVNNVSEELKRKIVAAYSIVLKSIDYCIDTRNNEAVQVMIDQKLKFEDYYNYFNEYLDGLVDSDCDYLTVHSLEKEILLVTDTIKKNSMVYIKK